MISVDGFFAGPRGEIDWHNVDEEFNQFAIKQTKSFGTLLFGRVTYELMASYWPTPDALKDDPQVAQIMNSIDKVVFSKTLTTVTETPTWKNVTLLKEIVPEQIKKLKQEQSGDIAIFGSGTIVQQLTNLGLIDEYWLMVNPVVLGAGKSLFKALKEPLNLALRTTKKFQSGNVLLYYQRV